MKSWKTEIENRKLKIKIAQVKEKKKVLESFIESLNIAIEKCSIAAEKEAGLSLLTKANSFRVSVHSKKESLTAPENAKKMWLNIHKIYLYPCFEPSLTIEIT